MSATKALAALSVQVTQANVQMLVSWNVALQGHAGSGQLCAPLPLPFIEGFPAMTTCPPKHP